MNNFGETVIEAADISKVYWDGGRPLTVFENISLSAKSGEGVAILGPSGSGKTTLLNILSGLDSPTRGNVRVQGVELASLSGPEKARFRNERVGFVFQFYHLLSEFTALENVMLPALMRGRAAAGRARSRAWELLTRVGLEQRAGHFPSQLSGGEQQRVAIARSLVNDPAILFCDEPTGNLDAERAGQIAGLLRDLHQKEKRTVLVVTHDQRIAKMADRVWNMLKGDWEG